MRIRNLSVYPPPKFSSPFLKAQEPLPKSSAGDAKNGSPGSGMTDDGRNVSAPSAAIQVNNGARSPPTGLIVQRSKPGYDPKATLTNRSPVRKFSERSSVPGPVEHLTDVEMKRSTTMLQTVFPH